MKITSIDRLHLRSAVGVMKAVSERYAPNVTRSRQCTKIKEELWELERDMLSGSHAQERAAKECADVIIAATRLGTMLSPDFAKVLADKLEELNGREALP